MAYVNDAQTLAQVVGGGAAAQQMGIQNDAANEEQQIKNTTLQGQQAAEIAKPGLANMFTQAQTANENAVGQQNQQTADIGKATLPSKIGATNAANTANMTADQAKSLSTFGGIAGQVAGMLDSVPAAARPAAMAQITQKYGIDIGGLPQELQNGDPDILRQVGQKAVQASAAYQEQQLKGTQEFTKAVTTTGQLVGGRSDVAQVQAQAKQDVADTNAAVKRQLAPVGAIVGQLVQKAAAGKATPEENAILQWYQNSQQLIKNGSPFQAGITNTNVQGNIPAVPGSTQAPVSNPGPAIQKALEAAGQAYEPDKFQYQIGPNGNLQRKAK